MQTKEYRHLEENNSIDLCDKYEFRKIELSDKGSINDIRKRYHYTTANYNFTTLYMWQNTCMESICIQKDFFVVREEDISPDFYYFPCGSPQKIKNFITWALKIHGNKLIFGYMRNQEASFLKLNFPGCFAFEEDRDRFEYIYSAEEQRNLEGIKFKKIRKYISNANKNLNLSCEPITLQNLKEVKKITIDWNRQHTEESDSYYGDVEPCLFLLESFERLELFGILVKNNDLPCAFVMGSELTDDTVDLHVAKCSYLARGLDYSMKKMFYDSLDAKYKYINREEDLGNIGLRERKLSSRPISLTAVWKGAAI